MHIQCVFSMYKLIIVISVHSHLADMNRTKDMGLNNIRPGSSKVYTRMPKKVDRRELTGGSGRNEVAVDSRRHEQLETNAKMPAE